MNDESAIPKSTDGTPPERQIPLHLTPLATDELPSTPNLISAVLDLIKQRWRYILTDRSRESQVRPSEYKILLGRLELDQLPKLQKFVNDKLNVCPCMPKRTP